MIETRCQRCWRTDSNWLIRQAEIHVGSIDHWKMQLCRDCTAFLERTILAAAAPLVPHQETK